MIFFVLYENQQQRNWAEENGLSWDGAQFDKWTNHVIGKQLMNINVTQQLFKKHYDMRAEFILTQNQYCFTSIVIFLPL